MKKQMLSLVFILAAVLLLSLPNLVFAYLAELPLVRGYAWEYGPGNSWNSRELRADELNYIKDGNSITHTDTLSSSIYRPPETDAAIFAPWVVVAFDASRLTTPTETLTLKASAYTINKIDNSQSQYHITAGNNSYIYEFVSDNWSGQDPNDPNNNGWIGCYGPWNTAISQDSPSYTVIRNLYQGRDISPEKLIWLKIGSGANVSGGIPFNSVATFQLTLNEISLAGDITTVPLPPSVYLFGSGLVGLIGLRRFKKA